MSKTEMAVPGLSSVRGQ